MMAQINSAAWLLSTALFFSGMAVAVFGVGVFGRHFIRANARAAQEQTSGEAVMAWGGVEARFGLKILAAGVLLHLSGYFLGKLLTALA